ncbi:MAG: four helix bundle protein [Candidatus Buchananbacteria bacterium]
MAQIKTYRDLSVWQKSLELVTVVYQITENFPRSEIYGLTSQMRRAAVSIVSNIAEGKARGTRKDYRLFILYAFGSGSELEAQVIIAKRLFVSQNINYETVDNLLDQVMKMLNVLIRKLDPSNLAPKT